tara:strand:- start:20 stop:139 length:120 start_codon:yes stop_codon:yes gene_type:complete
MADKIASDLKNMTDSQFRTVYKQTKAAVRKKRAAAKKTN